MTSAPFLPPLSAADALGFRGRRWGATATAVSVPPSSPGLRPGSALFLFTASFLAATRQSFVKRHECASLPSRTRLRKPHDLDHRLLCRVTIGVHVRVRVAVERLSLLLLLAHPPHLVFTLLQPTGSRLPHALYRCLCPRVHV